MLAYRHAFHAGNHADVLKHAVLLACLSHLQQKPGPVLVVDTHAGAGAYTPDGPLTRQKSEWHTGLGRLWPMREDNMPSLVRQYVQAVRVAQPGPAPDQPLVLPGSPWLITHQMRSQDAIRCCEAHPTDFPLLQAMLGPLDVGHRRFRRMALSHSRPGCHLRVAGAWCSWTHPMN
ncbi:MAG: 23S rRNA (adenine(2030)-N(6))-methyltransferase RlmJ [Burkholderiaceae bacterium]